MDMKFAPFSSRVNPGFWISFSKLKLEVLGLDDKPISITGSYDVPKTGKIELPPILDLDRINSKPEGNTLTIPGTLINQNTLEAFKTCNKTELLEEILGSQIRTSIKNGEAFENPQELLNKFLLLGFADLKKYNYYYWFAFLGFVLPESIKIENVSKLDDQKLFESLKGLTYFVIKKNGTVLNNLSLIRDNYEEVEFIGFVDPCTIADHPGWPMRNLLALTCHYVKNLNSLKIISLRSAPETSVVFTLSQNEETHKFDIDTSKVVGWEKNDKGKLGPRLASMKSTMDPKCLAESSVDLNLKLMKWRLVPNLDLESIAKTKVLLLGSGTLGCNVARCCLGWGIRNITFVDNSKISYSNPVRQSLFEFKDCIDGGKHKAKAAAEKLKEIFPGVKSKGIDLSIPMPGHPIGELTLEESRHQFQVLDNLVKEHDVIFLLMDTRESRWLPTVMGMCYGKLVMNSALGFDSFVVMRHGVRNQEIPSGATASGDFHPPSPPESDEDFVPGDQLGCYFCNDIVAPGNSTRDRTLDQQCTVTRPGLSYTAAALAVELMASTLQHPLKGMAPAPVRAFSAEKGGSTGGGTQQDGILGSVPHSVRGSIHDFSQFKPTTALFSHCTACSPKILENFSSRKFDFLLEACSSPTYLEDLSGLSTLMADTNFKDILEFADDDSCSTTSESESAK